MEKVSIVVDAQEKIVKTWADEKNIYSGNDPKLTLTLTLTRTFREKSLKLV